MDYQLILFLDKKKLSAWDVTEDGEAEEISIDGNASMDYKSTENFDDFAQYICDAYNVDTIEEMNAAGTIVNCGTDVDTCIALLECFRGFESINAIDVKSLLPIVLQNKGILEANTKTVVNVMGNYFAVKCDADGIAAVSKNRVTEDAVELKGIDFSLLYFFASNGRGGASKEEVAAYEVELANYKKQLEQVQLEAERKIVATRLEIEAKYDNIVSEHARYKKIVDALEEEKRKNSGKFANVGIGDIVKFGKYYINNVNQKQDIEWQVLDIENKKVLLLSKNGLEVMKFDNTTNQWAQSSVRSWLNSVFVKFAFTSKELNMICSTNTEIECNDKLFLLSGKEAESYFVNDDTRKCQPTTYAEKNCSDCSSDGSCKWWLRSSVRQNHNDVLCVLGNGYINGSVGIFGFPIGTEVYENGVCVRPAMWINIEA